LTRIAACGQASAQSVHWVQMSLSQTGTSWAIERFSQLGGVGREGAVDGQGRHRQQVAVALHDAGGDALHEVGAACGHRRAQAQRALALGRDGRLVQVREGRVHGGVVARQHGAAALAVGLVDRVLDLVDRLVARQHAREGEEAGLHDRVDAPAHADVVGDLVAVDRPQLEAALAHDPLALDGQVVPELAGRVRALNSTVAPGAASPSTSRS
jgi:hypothetical protein